MKEDKIDQWAYQCISNENSWVLILFASNIKLMWPLVRQNNSEKMTIVNKREEIFLEKEWKLGSITTKISSNNMHDASNIN